MDEHVIEVEQPHWLRLQDVIKCMLLYTWTW
jgi:hypothetical protein